MPKRAATPDDMCALFPEFATSNPVFLQAWLDATVDQISLDCWNLKASTGHAALAAHYVTISKSSSGEKGVVSERQIDKLRIKYAEGNVAQGVTDPHFSTTRYGRMYLAIRSTLLIAGTVGRTVLLRPPVV